LYPGVKLADVIRIGDGEIPDVADEGVAAEVAVLRLRADSMRRMADGQHPLVAQAYLRRASELEFQAWLIGVSAAQAVAA
jgi:hypothetical protein